MLTSSNLLLDIENDVSIKNYPEPYVFVTVASFVNIYRGRRTSLVFSFYWLLLFLCQLIRFRSTIIHESIIGEEDETLLSKFTVGWLYGLVIRGLKHQFAETDLKRLLPKYYVSNRSKDFGKYWNAESKKRNPSLTRALVKSFGWKFCILFILKLISSLIPFLSPQLLERILLDYEELPPSDDKSKANVSKWLKCCSHTALRLSLGEKSRTSTGKILNLMAVDAKKFRRIIEMLNIVLFAPITISIAIYFLWQIIGVSTMAGLATMLFIIPLNIVINIFIKRLEVKNLMFNDTRLKKINESLTGIRILKLYAWEIPMMDRIFDVRTLQLKVLKYRAYLSSATVMLFRITPDLVALFSFAAFVLVDKNNVLTANVAFVSISLMNIMRPAINLLTIAVTAIFQFTVSLKRIQDFLLSEECEGLDVNLGKCTPFSLNCPYNYYYCDNLVRKSMSSAKRRFDIFLPPTDTSPLSKSSNTVAIISSKNMLNKLGDDPKGSVSIKDGHFKWNVEDKFCLKDINVSIKPSSLTAIVGDVGAGKSSILHSFLGEMIKTSGRASVNGSIGYVPQQPWILNMSAMKNIIFQKKMNRQKYDRIVNACCLKQDFENFPIGDEAEIGEKGINLSGGQKQRISLARAIYQDADIYLLDDTLSSVDSHVSKEIFNKVIGPDSLLRNKTRIFVTHSIKFLPKCDHIIVMKDGVIKETGTYFQLLNDGREFSDFLKKYLNQDDVEDTGNIKEEFEDSDDMEIFKSIEKSVFKKFHFLIR
ncbi:Multidrug resistance-associated protein 1 [Nymphon striatum]|nr:Multidrug resistance-associated protein 1 [Nymphon striatum]